MNKTLVIGIGGTGLQIIRQLRRQIVERHGSLDAEGFRNLGFLFIDTNLKEVQSMETAGRKSWEVLGKSVALRPNEICIVGVKEMDEILKNPREFASTEDWFPSEQLAGMAMTGSQNPGASQLRPLGRLVFTLNAKVIRDAFNARYVDLNQAEGGGATRVIIACSVSGGTGSGMFLDVAYNIREWTHGEAETFGFLVLPDLKTSDGDRYFPNAYAALLELNYFSLEDTVFPAPLQRKYASRPPFDNCYLLSPNNSLQMGHGHGVELSYQALTEMIAHRIYLNFDQGFAAGATAVVDSVLSNARDARAQSLADPFNGNLHSRNFFTFGLSSIKYPTEQITEILALKLSGHLFQSWTDKRNLPDNPSDLAKSYLPEIKASDDYLIGEQDIFGKATYGRIGNEVAMLLDSRMKALPSEHKAVEVRRIWNETLAVYRQVGHTAYYKNRRDDLPGAVQAISREAVRKLCGFVVDPTLGHEFALLIIAKFREILGEKHIHFRDESKRVETVVKTSKGTVESYLSDLTEAEGKWVFRDPKVQKALTNVQSSLVLNLTAQVEKEAFDYAVLLISELLEEFKRLEEQFQKWALAMDSLRRKINEEVKRLAVFLESQNASAKDFNGSVLFRQEKFDQVYAQFDLTESSRYLREQLLFNRDVLSLLIGDPTQSSVQLVDQTIERTRKIAIDWLTQQSLVKITQRNIGDQLFEEYPNEAELERHLKVNYNKSVPFLVFNQNEVIRRQNDPRSGYTPVANAQVRLGAVMDDESRKFENVYKVRKLIRNATALDERSITRINDHHQIIFLQEITAFPLRVLDIVGKLRDSYRNSRDPLHVSRHLPSVLPDLLYFSQDEINKIHRAEEDFLIGWSFGLIRKEEDRINNETNVYYVYQEHGSNTRVLLGPDWESAFRFWMTRTADIEKQWERLRKTITERIDKMIAKPERAGFSRSLLDLVNNQAPRLPYGDQDPVFKQYDDIRRRIVQHYALPVETAPPPPQPPPPPPPVDPERRFRARAEAFYEQGKGKVSPAKETLLQNFRRDLGLSESVAAEIIRSVQAAFAPAETAAMAEYRQLVEAYLSDGPLTDSARADLEAERERLGLSTDQAGQILSAAGA